MQPWRDDEISRFPRRLNVREQLCIYDGNPGDNGGSTVILGVLFTESLLGFSKNSNYADSKQAGYRGHFTVSIVSNPYDSNVIG